MKVKRQQILLTLSLLFTVTFIISPLSAQSLPRAPLRDASWLSLSSSTLSKSPAPVDVLRHTFGADTSQEWVALDFPKKKVNSLFIDSLSRMWIGADSGLYRSVDGGASWDLFALDGLSVGVVTIDSKGRLFAVTNHKEWDPSYLCDILRSADGGKNWQRVFAQYAARVVALASYPQDNFFFAAKGQSGVGGIYYSSDGAQTWRQVLWGGTFTSSGTALLVTGSGVVYAGITGYRYELYQMTSTASNLRVLGEFYAASIAVDSNNILYAGDRGLVRRSFDGGKSWTDRTANLPDEMIQGLTYSPTGNLFALASDSVYVSPDRGESWAPLTKGLPATKMIAIQMDSHGYLFVATADSGVFRTRKPIVEIPATRMVLTSGNEQRGYILADLLVPFIVTVVDNDGNPAPGTRVLFALESIPSGAEGQILTVLNTITDVNGQASAILKLGNKEGRYTVTATSMDRSFNSVRFTATTQGFPASFVLYQNYPNPFNERTNIEYDVVDARGGVDVETHVYNALGENVKTLVSRRHAGGRFTVVWDGTDDQGNKLPSGAYYYQLISGSFISAKKMIMLK